MEWLSLLTDNLGVVLTVGGFLFIAIFLFKDIRREFENIEDLNTWQDKEDQ